MEMRSGPSRVERYNPLPRRRHRRRFRPRLQLRPIAPNVRGAAADRVLPDGFGYEWTSLAYQQIIAGNTAAYIFPLCVLFVFLILAALYESWSLPLAIILVVPMCILAALFGVWLRGMDNNILTQIGFVVLVGLACKNAILVVEFARQLEDAGQDRFAAVAEASRQRLRPILMTSFAFIPWRAPAGDRHRRGSRNAAGARHRRLLRHDRGHDLRTVIDPGFLHRRAQVRGSQGSVALGGWGCRKGCCPERGVSARNGEGGSAGGNRTEGGGGRGVV